MKYIKIYKNINNKIGITFSAIKEDNCFTREEWHNFLIDNGFATKLENNEVVDIENAFECIDIDNNGVHISLELYKSYKINMLKLLRIERLKKLDIEVLKSQEEDLLGGIALSDKTKLLIQKKINLRNMPTSAIWQKNLSLEEIRNINLETFE